MAHDLLPEDEKNTLLLAIDFLDKYDYTDSFMARKYCLSRKSLWSVRKGQKLKSAHSSYLRCYLSEMYVMLRHNKLIMNEFEYRKIKDFMFVIMAYEMGIKDT